MSKVRKVTKQKIVAVDLFCGAGGLSLGLQASGIEVAAGIDLDPDCRFPFATNIRAPFFEKDIKATTGREIKALFGKENFSLIAACAPCQPFSGYSLGRGKANKDWALLLEVSRLIMEAQPDFITIENVPRLKFEPIWQTFLEHVERAGYKIDWSVLDASKYGVPQRRKRLVLLGSKHGPISLPKPTNEVALTVRDMIGGLRTLSAGETDLYDELHSARSLNNMNLARIRQSKPGENWRSWPKKMKLDCHKKATGKSFPSVYGRMNWDEPSPTITTQFYGYGNGRFGHPAQDRAVSLREGAILQSFPSDFLFSKSVRGRVRQIGKLIGNAVPPKLAQEIGLAISDHAATITLGLVAK